MARADPVPYLVCGIVAWALSCVVGIAAGIQARTPFYSSRPLDLDEAWGSITLAVILMMVAAAFVCVALVILAAKVHELHVVLVQSPAGAAPTVSRGEVPPSPSSAAPSAPRARPSGYRPGAPAEPDPRDEDDHGDPLDGLAPRGRR